MGKAILTYCVTHGIVSEEDIPTLDYCIYKTITSKITVIMLAVIGTLFSDVFTTVAFLYAFCSLRKTINGFHAKTISGCLFGSVTLEFLLLTLARQEYSLIVKLILIFLSSCIIWSLAPFNHPNMNLSKDEIDACRHASRKQLLFLLTLVAASYVASKQRILNGLCAGIVLAAGLLSLAYLINYIRRKNNA